MSQPESFDINDPNLKADDYVFSDEKTSPNPIEEDISERAKTAKSLAWFRLVLGLFSSLLMLGFSLWVFELYEKAKIIHPFIGWLTLGLFTAFMLSLIFLTLRQFYSLLKLRSVKNIRLKTQKAFAQNNRSLALEAMTKMSKLYQSRPSFHNIISKLKKESQKQVDGHAILRLTEEYLLSSLDKEAQKIIQRSSKQVAVSTALSRLMILDILIVFFSSWQMTKRLAELYGLRPSNLSLWRLFMQIFSHLIITGGMAAGEDFLSSLLGHGMAAKISSRLGEGVINGLLTCRIGLVALDYCRPMAYLENEKPKLQDIAQTFLPKVKP